MKDSKLTKQQRKEVKRISEETVHNIVDYHMVNFINERVRDMMEDSFNAEMTDRMNILLDQAVKSLHEKVANLFHEHSRALLDQHEQGVEEAVITAIREMLESDNKQFNEFKHYKLVPRARIYMHIRQKKRLREVFNTRNLRDAVNNVVEIMINKRMLYETIPPFTFKSTVRVVGVMKDIKKLKKRGWDKVDPF